MSNGRSTALSLPQSPGRSQEGPLDRKGEIDGLHRVSDSDILKIFTSDHLHSIDRQDSRLWIR